MDIKGITETSLMWFSSVAIQLPRYARYLQYGRMSVTEPRQQEGKVDKAFSSVDRDTFYCP